VQLDGTSVTVIGMPGGPVPGCTVVSALDCNLCRFLNFIFYTDKWFAKGQGACEGAIIDDADEPAVVGYNRLVW
jgi:hypothetical protein